MFTKGKCAIYIDKNLKVYENSTDIFVLWSKMIEVFLYMLSAPNAAKIIRIQVIHGFNVLFFQSR